MPYSGSYLNDVYTDWRIQREMFSPEYGLAQNGPGPKYFGKHLDEVIITAKRNSQIELSLTGRALGKAIGAFAANMGTVVESWPPYSYTGAITPSYPEAMLMPIPKIGFAAKTGTQGFKSLGAAGKGYNEVLQSGGQSLKPNTLKALNLTKEQGRNAIHGLKSELGLPNNFHGKIIGN